MHFLLPILFFILVSCGQSTSSKGGNNQEDSFPTNEEYLTDIREVDLLDVAMDVPVEITGNKIIFKQSITNLANGMRSTCTLGVTEGETYDYRLQGSNLIITTSGGTQVNLKRVSGDSGIVGSWTSKTYQGQQLVLRRMTFVSEGRLVMRTHCES